MVYYNLKALIKAIRATKTIADERALIVKESAAIRTGFKEEDSFTRYHNIAKLLYIHMLGYPAHFGQIDCLKLVASPRFTDKRLGYLGIMLLLDENQEVLTLVTNSLKNDLNSANTQTVALALCTFANISSEEMARDLVTEIERCLSSSNAYIRKKAALAAVRCVYKVPDLAEHFEAPALALLTERNPPGVLMTGITLVTELARMLGPGRFARATPALVRHLRTLLTQGFAAEFDVGGVNDPFLQVKILRLLRVLLEPSPTVDDSVNDLLTQIATNTEGAKNAGNAILYETVLTILAIEADASLRVVAINILGQFLANNKDNNIRYVALNTLNKVVAVDTAAVKRHQATILDCLRDGDISIRRRALELTYALIDASNVRILVRELLSFLQVADDEFRLSMTTQICTAADRFAPNARWHIDTVLRVLKLAGNFVKEEVFARFVSLVANAPTDLQKYAVQRLYAALKDDLSQEYLTLAGVYLLGEFGDLLLSAEPAAPSEDGEPFAHVGIPELVALSEGIINSPYVNANIRQFVVVALAKLSARVPFAPKEESTVKTLLGGYSSSIELELQQRSVEFDALLYHVDAGVRTGVLEKMPVPEVKRLASTVNSMKKVRAPIPSTQSGEAPASKPAMTQDLLADLFDSSPATASAPAASASATAPLDDLLGATPAPAAAPTAPTAVHAYNAHGLAVSFLPSKDASNPLITNVLARFACSGASRVSAVNLQAAVPKSMKLQMQPISSAAVTPGTAGETQILRVMTQKPDTTIKLRLKINFSVDGQTISDLKDVALAQN